MGWNNSHFSDLKGYQNTLRELNTQKVLALLQLNTNSLPCDVVEDLAVDLLKGDFM
jgi:hypothetical protein